MIGRTVAQYEIVEKLGEGGMGAVYRARDVRLERDVAVKALPPEHLGDDRRRARFLREARAASALNHPHIVTIHDVLSVADGEFIVMECVEGRRLDAHIVPGGMSIAEAVSYAAQIADGVAAAHAAGLVHRDLKPANVMVTDDGRVKILDFGIAKLDPALAGEATDEATALTVEGSILGTIHYMAPEQVRGEPADRRTDVFALGVILYEMVTGERPFRGANPATLVHQITSVEPPPAIELRGDIPEGVIAVLERALAKDRGERYDGMGPMAADLRTLRTSIEAADASSPGGAPPREGSRLPWPRPTRRSALVVAIIALAVLGYFTLGNRVADVLRGSSTSAPTGVPDTAFAHFQEGMELLERHDREGALERAQEAFERSIAMDDDYAPAYAGLGRALLHRYLDEVDPIWLRQARGNAEQALRLNEHLALAHTVLGEVELESDRPVAAAAAFERALELDPGAAAAHIGQGHLLSEQDDAEAAEAAYLRGTEAAPTSWSAFDDLGTFYFRQGRYEQAREAFERAVDLAPDSHVAHRDLAGAHQMLGDYAAAARELQEALAIRPEATVFSNLGTLLFYQGLYQQAVRAFEEAVELEPNRYLLWANLGDGYRFVPDGEQDAREAYRRAVQLLDERLADDPENVTLRSRRAVYLAKRGDAAEALTAVAEFDDGVEDVAALYMLSMAAEIAGDREVALSLLERSLDAGLPLSAVESEPEFNDLRADADYHRLAARYEERP